MSHFTERFKPELWAANRADVCDYDLMFNNSRKENKCQGSAPSSAWAHPAGATHDVLPFRPLSDNATESFFRGCDCPAKGDGSAHPMSQSVYKKVGIAAVIMMLSVFLSRVIGLLREMIIAYIGGAGQAVDAYQIAFLIPEILNHIVASGFLSVTFIPIFSGYLFNNQETEGWKVFSIIFNCFGLFLVILVLISILFAPELVGWLAPGLKDPGILASAARMTRIILPAQLFFFFGGLLMAVQFSKERFLVPALAPLLYNLGIILGGIGLGPWLGMEGFAWGVLIGALAGNLLVQFYGAGKVGLQYFFIFDFRHPDLQKYIRLTLPLMVGLTMTFSTEFFFRLFGSYLSAGRIAVLNFGLRIMLIMVALFGQAVGTASYPFMARLAAENKLAEMNRLLNQTLRYLALVIPLAALLIVLRFEVVRLLFQRGRFDATATALTAEVLLYFLIGAFAFAAHTVVVRAYFASQNTLFPAVYGTIAVILCLPLYVIGMNLLGASGIALAVSLAGIFQVTILYALWNKRSQNPGGRDVYLFYLKMMGLAALIGVLLAWFKERVFGGIASDTFVGSLFAAVSTGGVFLGILLLCGYGLKIKEITNLVQRLSRKRAYSEKG
jgi:putative peptidoglycan lipid II flippase